MHSLNQRRTLTDFIQLILDRRSKMLPKMTSAEIAETVGVTPETVSRWKNGQLDRIDMSNLIALLKLIGAEIGDCLYLPDEVSDLRSFEVAYLARMDLQRQKPPETTEVLKKPSKTGGSS